MAFVAGDRVHLAGLGTGTVLEARGGDRYAIDIKGRVVVARGGDLEKAAAPLKGRRESDRSRGDTPDLPVGTAVPALDLHGMTVEEALAAVNAFVNEALLSGYGRIQVIHGKGRGRLKAGVHQALGRLSVVADVRLDPHNAGVTLVTFV